MSDIEKILLIEEKRNRARLVSRHEKSGKTENKRKLRRLVSGLLFS
ncbi:MAG: hypothetical protein M3525_13140 [Acidobacteriota bacterium]|nr:hypothetical protein [Acidobacteriota bacterium]